VVSAGWSAKEDWRWRRRKVEEGEKKRLGSSKFEKESRNDAIDPSTPVAASFRVRFLSLLFASLAPFSRTRCGKRTSAGACIGIRREEDGEGEQGGGAGKTIFFHRNIVLMTLACAGFSLSLSLVVARVAICSSRGNGGSGNDEVASRRLSTHHSEERLKADWKEKKERRS
jgi:hypothetical protein